MEGFRFTIVYVVRIADINYGGHVANSALLDIFQEGRIAYLQQLGGFSERNLGGCGMILSEARLYYRAEMMHHDRLLVGVRIPAMAGGSCNMEYRIERDGVLVAEGTTRLAAFDYQRRKPTRWPKAFRDGVTRFESLDGIQGTIL